MKKKEIHHNKLLIATTNPGKLNEIRSCLNDVSIELVSLGDVGITDTPEETGKTFEENAVLKALHYATVSKLPTIADDGGLEIDALGGEPGIKSHRWIHGDREDTDGELIRYTVERMKSFPMERRGAQLRVVVAFSLPDGIVKTEEEKIRGIIPLMPSDKRIPGFPYRSLLYLPELRKFYNDDELTAEENAAYNHRRKALEKLKPIITATLMVP